LASLERRNEAGPFCALFAPIGRARLRLVLHDTAPAGVEGAWKVLILLGLMVGATGIEPVTPPV
jgi:hypothetical protein